MKAYVEIIKLDVDDIVTVSEQSGGCNGEMVCNDYDPFA